MAGRTTPGGPRGVTATRIVAVAVAAAGMLLPIAGCGNAGSDGNAVAGDEAAVRGEMIVFAAASLTDAFDEIAAVFEDEHPGTQVQVSHAASSTLARQVIDGAPADVLATADTATMADALESGRADESPAPFARNHLVLAVPAGNPAGIDSLEDLARDDVYVGLCAVEVPCGALAAELLDRVGVVAAVDSDEPNVRALLTKLEAAEFDAGLVYRTDVFASHGRVEAIDVPAAAELTTTYPIVALTGGGNPTAGVAFADFVQGEQTQAILAEHGVLTP